MAARISKRRLERALAGYCRALSLDSSPIRNVDLFASLMNEGDTSGAAVRAFISKYCEAFHHVYGTNPVITRKDAGISRQIIEAVGLERAVELAKVFLSMKSGWFIKRRHDLLTMSQNLNAIAISADTGNRISDREAASKDLLDSNASVARKYLGKNV